MADHPHFLWRDLFHKLKSKDRTIPHLLKENILFKTLTDRELSYLASLVYQRIYQTNEYVFRQNERGFGMYMIAKGSVAIRSETPEGEMLVTTLSEGSFFGEIALIESENLRTASVAALERTMIIGFFKPDLLDILDRKPDMGVKILYQLSSVIARRLVETTEKISQMKNQLQQKAELKT